MEYLPELDAINHQIFLGLIIFLNIHLVRAGLDWSRNRQVNNVNSSLMGYIFRLVPKNGEGMVSRGQDWSWLFGMDEEGIVDELFEGDVRLVEAEFIDRFVKLVLQRNEDRIRDEGPQIEEIEEPEPAQVEPEILEIEDPEPAQVEPEILEIEEPEPAQVEPEILKIEEPEIEVSSIGLFMFISLVSLLLLLFVTLSSISSRVLALELAINSLEKIQSLEPEAHVEEPEPAQVEAEILEPEEVEKPKKRVYSYEAQDEFISRFKAFFRR